MMEYIEEQEENRENCTCKCEMQNDCNQDNRREEMARKIKEYRFSIIELGLYLDTHPDDQRALCIYREDARRLKDLKDKYQKIYGPLTIFFPCNKWRWLEEPWPWEGGDV